MPTGYTYDVIEKDITFREYALRCLRAFGALICVRDEDPAKIITSVPLDSYYQESVDKARNALQEFVRLSNDERRAVAINSITKAYEESKKAYAQVLEENARLDKIADQVRAWIPPTPEHEEYKAFMLDQLKISHNNPSYYKPKSPDTRDMTTSRWADEHLASLEQDLEYHKNQLQERTEQNNKGNAWLKSVVDSLPEE